MTSQNDWDVERLKTEHECDEHWELKRKFILAHKDRFPEDDLICLAQVFTNVELLGCRYPNETMQLIAELAKDIVGEYREKQKNKLQRTFVKASDAASSKVKGKSQLLQNFTNKFNENSCQGNSHDNERVLSNKKIKLDLPNQPYGEIVIVERPNDSPQSILMTAINTTSEAALDWKYKKKKNMCECTVTVNDNILGKATAETQKLSKKAAAELALIKLKKFYYTIKVKEIDKKANISMETMVNSKASSEKLPTDNVGEKIMKLMGWTGGALGKSQQGIMEPVNLKQQINRVGLGLKPNSYNTQQLKELVRKAMEKYMMTDMSNDLVFTSDFSNEERMTIHQVASRLGLKSQSYGPKNQRTLVVSRKINFRKLVQELISLGGKTEKYELINPTFT